MLSKKNFYQQIKRLESELQSVLLNVNFVNRQKKKPVRIVSKIKICLEPL